MNLNAQQREQLRLSLLRFLNDNPARYGLPTELLLQMARAEGRPQLDKQNVVAELEYLVEKSLAQEVPKTLSPEIRNWKITANGRDHFAQQNEE